MHAVQFTLTPHFSHLQWHLQLAIAIVLRLLIFAHSVAFSILDGKYEIIVVLDHRHQQHKAIQKLKQTFVSLLESLLKYCSILINSPNLGSEHHSFLISPGAWPTLESRPEQLFSCEQDFLKRVKMMATCD